MKYKDGECPEDLRQQAREVDRACQNRLSGEVLGVTTGLLRAAANKIEELEKKHEAIGIQEICQWIVDAYPRDVFTGKSGNTGAVLIAGLRDHAAEILKFRKEADDADSSDK